MDTGRMVLVAALALAASQDPQTFNGEYKDKAAAAAAATLESGANSTYRYRVHIVNLLQLKPGMAAAEIGARSGFVSRLMAERVGSGGLVIATDPDPKMVAYMTERARAEGIANLTVKQGRASATGLEPASVDAIAFVARLSADPKPEDMLASVAAALKPQGLLLVVDTPREGQGAAVTGLDAEAVIALAEAAGFEFVNENGTVPGHYSLRFRKR
jgi:ubiquinone/menaquinone biosynthesis C-methylase UbiE